MPQSYGNLATLTMNTTSNGLVGILPAESRTLTVEVDDGADADCWVRAPISPTSAPSAPNATPAVNDDMTAAGWIRLKGKGSTHKFPALEFGFYKYVEVRVLGTGGGLKLIGSP